MTARLTLELDEDVIRRAERASARTGKSVARLVSDYFAEMDEEPDEPELTPRVKFLFGLLAGSGVDEQDYYRYLEEKYG